MSGSWSPLRLFRTLTGKVAEKVQRELQRLAAGESKGPDPLRPLAEPIRSLAAAAQIGSLPVAVAITRGLEDFLHRVSAGKAAVDDESLKTVAELFDLMTELADQPDEELDAWSKANAERVGELAKRLGTTPEPSIDPLLSKADTQAIRRPGMMTPPPGTRGRPGTTRDDVAEGAEGAEGARPDTRRHRSSEWAVLELIRTELEVQVRALRDGLSSVAADDPGADLAPLIKAAASVTGAARVAELDSMAELSGVLERVLKTAAAGNLALDADRLDALLRSVETVTKIAEMPAEDLTVALTARGDEISARVAELQAIEELASAEDALELDLEPEPDADADADEEPAADEPITGEPPPLQERETEAVVPSIHAAVTDEAPAAVDPEAGTEAVLPIAAASRAQRHAAALASMDLAPARASAGSEPRARASTRALLVRVSGAAFALPLVRLGRIVPLGTDDEDDDAMPTTIDVDGKTVKLHAAAELLDVDAAAAEPTTARTAVILEEPHDGAGLVVDELFGPCEVDVRPLDPRLGKVDEISGAVLLEGDEIALVVDVDGLARRF